MNACVRAQGNGGGAGALRGGGGGGGPHTRPNSAASQSSRSQGLNTRKPPSPPTPTTTAHRPLQSKALAASSCVHGTLGPQQPLSPRPAPPRRDTRRFSQQAQPPRARRRIAARAADSCREQASVRSPAESAPPAALPAGGERTAGRSVIGGHQGLPLFQGGHPRARTRPSAGRDGAGVAWDLSRRRSPRGARSPSARPAPEGRRRRGARAARRLGRGQGAVCRVGRVAEAPVLRGGGRGGCEESRAAPPRRAHWQRTTLWAFAPTASEEGGARAENQRRREARLRCSATRQSPPPTSSRPARPSYIFGATSLARKRSWLLGLADIASSLAAADAAQRIGYRLRHSYSRRLRQRE